MVANNIKLLLIDSDQDGACEICDALLDVAPTQFAITQASSLSEAIDLIKNIPFDVVLFDIAVAESEGLDAISQLSNINPSLPYIVLSNDDNEVLALEAVKYGAQDYLNKEKAHGNVLIRVVRYAIERKRSAHAIRSSKEQAHQLLDSADEGIFSVDLNGLCAFINPSAVRMLGYKHDSELLGEHMHSLIHHTLPDGNPCLEEQCLVSASFRLGKVFHVEDEVLWRSDGSSFAVEYRTAPTYINGKITGSVVTFSDITERKKVESNLKTAHNKLEQRVKERTLHLEKVNQLLEIEIENRIKAQEILDKEREFISALLDTVGALVCVLDTEGRIVVFNRACEVITGYRFAEVIGKYVWDYFIVDEEIETVKQVVSDLQSGQFPSRYENYWLTKNGERRLVVWSNTVLKDDAGVVQNVIGTGIDITEKQKIEEKENV